ncbi:DUF2200 domain-containing protein [Chryseobacterium sp. ISL-6]|uniref:DUF2200 domain-containing protein n=1 Tax=Chryseobacterium sp. ISL-6 TaxID=2819143 RepID=UPI001BEC33D9|nr:DUF2200 domain-containing protein [Chryseobacterium sp. ISL-6]MBT2620826.1 DUF2200 domain-containing protein [Chryseobacterium sp. ISL-6]
MQNNDRVYNMSFAGVYPHYIQKAEKKGRTKEEVHEIIFWLTGYNEKDLQEILNNKTNFRDFFEQAPLINPNVSLIKGVICGYRVEEIEDELMRKIRYLDKLIDELAKGKSMDKILRR